MATLEETLKKIGLATARGVPQLATGFVDLAALPFTATGLLNPEQVVGSTAHLTSKGLLPQPQPGLLAETTELVSSALNPTTAVKSVGLLGATKSSKVAMDAIRKMQSERKLTDLSLVNNPGTPNPPNPNSPKNLEPFESGIVDEKIGNSTISYQLGDDGVLKIFSLRTPQTKRGQGSAKAAMQQIIDRADRYEVPITLDASPLDKKTNLNKLVGFYRRFGFEPTGEKVNLLGEPVMFRNPKK